MSDTGGGWTLNLDRGAVVAAARRHAKGIAGRPRDEQIHEALGMVLAAVVIMETNGTFRHTVERWVRQWITEIYGWMN